MKDLVSLFANMMICVNNSLGQQVAFSPTYCSMIQMGDDGKVRWNKLHFPLGDIGNSMQDRMSTPTQVYGRVTDESSAILRKHCCLDRDSCTVDVLPKQLR